MVKIPDAVSTSGVMGHFLLLMLSAGFVIPSRLAGRLDAMSIATHTERTWPSVSPDSDATTKLRSRNVG